MPTRYKRYRGDAEKVERNKLYPLDEAIDKLKGFKATKFDQSVDLCMHLGVDPKHADQLVRGAISLPHGTGKSNRVICFCGADKVEAAKAAGAVEAGGEELAKKVEDGWMEFDVAVASPETMRFVGKLGKVLGPKGLMPSPKAGTVTPDVAKAVKEYAAGKIEFRTDKGGNVHAPVGKLSFSPQQIAENAQAFIDNIVRLKPSSVKGQYVKKVSLSGTMTPGVLVAV
ncbi:50S ribosomal protein L1 [Planctomycetales bacterium ZRK34]|nr:50S ribosomal protein L1 [Planctomycetales bacterium ZRK34]